MAIGVDTSKWKPRKIKGTPAARARNLIGIGILSLGICAGLFFQYSSLAAGLRKAVETLYDESIEEVERRQLIAAGIPVARADTIRRMIEEEKRPDLPYK